MTLLSESALFDGPGPPLRILDTTTAEPSGAVTAESVKVVFAMTGWSAVRSHENAIAASAGTILTIPAGLPCSGFPEALSRAITFYVHPEYLSDQMRWLTHRHPLIHQLHRAVRSDVGLQRLQLPPRAIQAMSTQLIRLAQLPRRWEHEFEMFSIASSVFDAVGRFAGVSNARMGDHEPTLARPRDEVIAAIDLMRNELRRDWRIDGLAHEVALSASQLSRLFRSQVGVSPAACLAGLRAERMAELLGTTSVGVAEAARASGWRNPTVASRLFKRRYGVSPREYARVARYDRSPELSVLRPGRVVGADSNRPRIVDCRSCGPASEPRKQAGTGARRSSTGSPGPRHHGPR